MIEDVWNQLITFSEQFVVPDWGALVGLIPILLLGLVVLYVTWTIYRFATAGPTRRGKRRITPVPPPGIHMPGGSLAPFLGAFGVLMLGIGIVVGGLWLWIGFLVLAITLLYWGREFLREFDHLPSDSTALVASGGTAMVPAPPPGALTAPAGPTPAGVHVPAPSFRPLLIAISMTLLVAGFVLGGWALILGAIALAVTMTGWLLDSRREYRYAVEADRTGHLDAGPSPSWPIATFAVLAWVLAGGLLLSSTLLPNSGSPAASGGPAASAGAGGGSGGGSGSAAAPSLPTADVVESAKDTAFVVGDLEAKAGTPFTIAFENGDPLPHNMVIKDASGTVVFDGKIVTGPTVIVYDVPALPAGTYPFMCAVHPTMTGTLTTK